ncbi:GumC family protein [Lyngbya confervoides]|uniref:Polysaccharide biosynthesis tyrosine autokinase n=1 Tax=Lyngbya confervoides BDU141951 TaxID=1574623 RepID=A0ABD4T9E1_9CYAN|nr:polysaccharide biosynthesis tyrosine autokinase [Lyngbya confervoides]MCM1985080.1 polysaccharide biosynthesis tyrosine autokinase [Lyngbya confervoides BDU141951]
MTNLAIHNNPLPPQSLGEQQQSWGYGQLFAILIRRKWWVISVFAGTIATTVVLTLRSTPIYQSATQLLIESSYSSVKGSSKDDFIEPNYQIDLATQLNVLKSSEILQRAVDKLRTDYPTISVKEIGSNLQVQPVYAQSESGKKNAQTKILLASYSSIDAIKTQKVLDAVLAVYQSYNLEQQQKRIQQGLEIINRKLPEVRGSVIEAEKALEAFRQANDVIDPQKESESMTAALSNLTAQRESLKAEIAQARANLAIARQQLPASPSATLATSAVNQSEEIDSLKTQRQQLELELASKRQELTEAHPALRELEQQLAQVNQLLTAEINRVAGGNGTSSPELAAPVNVTANELGLIQTITQLEQEVSSKQARDVSLTQTQEQLEQELKRYPALMAQYSRLQPEVLARRTTLEKLLDAKEELSLEIAKGGFNWEIVEPPQPGVLVSPNIKQNLLIGIISGLFFGGLAAFIREALDDKVRRPAELNEQLSLPVLGTVPQIGPLGSRDFPLALPFRNDSKLETEQTEGPEIFQWRPLREAMDLIYTNIQLLNSQRPHQSLMITSALSGEGKSTLAIGLAISASRVDQRVLVIDADMRKPRLHHIFNLSNEQGLSTLLEGGLSENEMFSIPQWVYMRWEDSLITAEEVDGRLQSPLSDLNIDVITSGPVQTDPVKLLTVDNIKQIIDVYRDSYDLILVDSPPVLGLVDAISVGYGCDGVVMVARVDQVKRSDLNRAVDTLSKLNVIGIIANGVNEAALQYYS